MATTDAPGPAGRSSTNARSLGPLDRGLYALFSRHADRARHEIDRKRYRGTALRTSFDVYLSRVYGLSWCVFLAGTLVTAAVVLAVPAGIVRAVGSFLGAGVPVVNQLDVPAVSRVHAAVGTGALAGALGKYAIVWFGGVYLRWMASARRSNIERTLPGAVRYLRVLASGSDDRRQMLRKVADQDAYGETAVAFRDALNKATLTGSLDEGLRMVARDTPSRDLLSPFLLKFREHANQSADALEGYLRMESRLLSHRQARARERAGDFLELLAEVFVVLLVLPALLVIILTVISVLAPGLAAPVKTPLGSASLRSVLVYGSAAFVLVVGASAAALVGSLRPPDQAPPAYRRPGGLATLRTALANPASTALVLLPLSVTAAVGLHALGYAPENVLLLGYVAFGLPVGLVALRRARIDDAKDREIRDFVHTVSGHVSLGRPFPEAVELVAREVDLGALQGDVNDLAFNLGLTTARHEAEDGSGAADGEGGNDAVERGPTDSRAQSGDVRTAALDRFVAGVGTRLAEQTIGLVTGALDVGSEAEQVFETLQTEIGRLYHERKALRSAMLVYVAVGWTTALLVVGIVVAVDGYVIDGFAQLSAVSGVETSAAIDPDAVQPERDRRRFYLVTQATMLACGWFAGMASRGRYEALLHSAVLVTIAYVVFAGVGMI